jgi:hypothetical protein
VLLGTAPSTAADPIAWVAKMTTTGQLGAQSRPHLDCNTIAAADDGTTLLLGTRQQSSGEEAWTTLLSADLKEQRAATTVVSGVDGIHEFTATALKDHE